MTSTTPASDTRHALTGATDDIDGGQQLLANRGGTR
jgi:hypothetical protein